MKDTHTWISDIDFVLESIRLRQGKCYYGFSLEMTQQTANEIKRYFEQAGHGVVIRECPRKLWDITIDL